MGNRRRRRNGLSRRRVLAGSFITAGGVLMLSDTGAFSQMAATRGASIGTSTDETALLGLDVPSFVRVGSEDEPLVTVTNNAEMALDVGVDLIDALESESVSPAETTLQADQSETFTAYIDPERNGGSGAVSFDVTATDTESLAIDLQRQTSLPELKRSIIDNTQDTNVRFDIQYRVQHVSAFSHMTLEVQNVDQNRYREEFTEITDSEGVIQYPPDGRDDGAGGNTYEFRFEVFDENHGRIIDETVTRVADGESGDDNDDLGSEDDPTLGSFTVVDRSSRPSGTILEVDYTVENTEHTERFEQVLVTFDTDADPGGHWADETISNAAEEGTVTHTEEGTYDSTYEVTVEVETQSGLIVDSGTVTIESGSEQTVSWP